MEEKNKMFRHSIKDLIYIDFESDIDYGVWREDTCSSAPCPIVRFKLFDTTGLSSIADKIRARAGFKPMHPFDEYTEKDCDWYGWYDFYIRLIEHDDRVSVNRSCILFKVVSDGALDNEEWYYIYLTENECEDVVELLDEQCCKHLGKSCKDLMAEAETRKEMAEE